MYWPMTIASGISTKIGITAPGLATNRLPITTANTAFTRVSRKKMISRNSVRARALITSCAMVPMFLALCRSETTSEPKSCTPAAKMVPSTIHASAGPQPQNTAIAGPTIGAAPATEVKWWPKTTCLLVGTKSTPSAKVCAGVVSAGSRA